MTARPTASRRASGNSGLVGFFTAWTAPSAPGRKPAEAWASFRERPLSQKEFRAVAANVAPYLR